MPDAYKDLEARLEETLQAAWTHDDAAHDISHIKRVRANALKIARSELDVSLPILLAAVWLHDLVNLEKNDPRRAQASTLAGEDAYRILGEWGWAENDRLHVAHAITAHSYSAGIEPNSIEAKILRDADRLDAIGAIGIARVFSIAGRLGRSLYNSDDPAGHYRPLDDNQFTLDHFYIKLFKLADGMLTDTGRKMAIERTDFMQSFVGHFLKEVN